MGGIVVALVIGSLAAAVPWFVAVICAVLGTFTIYIGVALAVALFHNDPAVRCQAAAILRHLLQAILLRGPQ
jgi:hypothetical protein